MAAEELGEWKDEREGSGNAEEDNEEDGVVFGHLPEELPHSTIDDVCKENR